MYHKNKQKIKNEISHALKRRNLLKRKYQQFSIFLQEKSKDHFVSSFNTYPTIFRKHYEELIIFLKNR